MDGFLDDEQPVERAARHALEGRIQFATVEALERLTTAVHTVSAKQEATDKKVDQIHGWLVGGVSEDGKPTDGILRQVSTLGGARNWILGLLGAATTAVIIQTALTIAKGWPH